MKDGSIFRLYYMGGLLAITALIPMSFFLGEKLIAMAKNLLRKKVASSTVKLNLRPENAQEQDPLSSYSSLTKEGKYAEALELVNSSATFVAFVGLFRLFDRLSRWLQRKTEKRPAIKRTETWIS